MKKIIVLSLMAMFLVGGIAVADESLIDPNKNTELHTVVGNDSGVIARYEQDNPGQSLPARIVIDKKFIQSLDETETEYIINLAEPVEPTEPTELLFEENSNWNITGGDNGYPIPNSNPKPKEGE